MRRLRVLLRRASGDADGADDHTRMNDGQIVEVNEGFAQTTGYSREEALGNTTIALGLWANPKDREDFVSALQGQSRLRGVEYDFRSRPGKSRQSLT